MLRRYALGFSSMGRQYSSTMSATPIEDAMRAKITVALEPSTLEIHNDSHLHAHHKAMAGSTSRETHFRLVITSAAFREKRQPARHRMVYALLREEMAAEGGIHALQLRTLTPDEEQKHKHKFDEAAAKTPAQISVGGDDKSPVSDDDASAGNTTAATAAAAATESA